MFQLTQEVIGDFVDSLVRVLVTQTIVDRVRGRVPVVVNTGGPVVELALLYSRLGDADNTLAALEIPRLLILTHGVEG